MNQHNNTALTDTFVGWKKKAVLFLASQTISLFGSSLVQFAIIWYITLNTQSGVMMTISTICSFLPQILISLFAGVWADRYNRKFLIMAADLLIAFSTLVLAIVFLMGHNNIWLLFAVSGIRSVGTGIQMPAVNSLIPQIVPVEKLIKVNGVNSSIQALIMLISPAVSGALLSMATLTSTFFVDIATALIGVGMLSFLKVTIHKKAEHKPNTGYFSDLKEGLRYVRSNYLIKSFLVFNAFFFFLVVPAAYLTPLMVARTFGEEVWRLTANEILFSAGAILGGALIAAWGGFKNRITTLAFACTGFGLLTALLGVSSTFFIYLTFIFITGIFMPFFSSASTVLLQEKVSPDMQGRVFGLVQIVLSAAMPLGMLLFGPLADVVPIELLLILTGILMIALGIVIFRNKRLKQAAEKTN